MAIASAGPSALWYLTRATGAVTLVLLTASLALGVANIGRVQSARWPRFVVEGLHRNVSLLAIAVLFVHIVTTVLDPFATIHAIDAVVPFISAYRPFWLGLGAFASDLLIAIALTSMMRRRLGHRAWRATHWFAYLCWPIAVLHAVGTGSDIKQLWMEALLAGCVIALIVAVWARVGFGWPMRRGLRGSAIAASIALPAAFALWLPSGPLGSNWAQRAGTPTARAASAANAGAGAVAHASSSAPVGSTPTSAFSAGVSGTVSQRQTANGLVEVDISLAVANAALPELRLQIVGNPTASGGVGMTASAVSLGPASNPTLYQGSITELNGTTIRARVAATHGRPLQLDLALQINPSTGAATGTVQVGPERRDR
jgi:sulfoxide reductase heme-binding subunit YedZ